MHAHICRYLSVLIFSFIVINSMPAGYCSKDLLYRCNQGFQMEAVFIKIPPSLNPTFYLWKRTGFNLNATGA